MKTRYVEIPLVAMHERLKVAGFVPVAEEGRGELKYARCHDKDPNLVIVVYTSIAKGSTVGRENGADAIRVTLTAKGRGVASAKKVLRTGSVEKVLGRTLERAREMYAVANGFLTRPKCRFCGFYCYGDTGKCADWNCRQRNIYNGQ